jgi:hypothetical protein
VEENEDIIEDKDRNLIQAIGILETLIYYRYVEDSTLTDQKIIRGLQGLENQLKTIELPGSPSEFADFAYEELKPLIDKEKIARSTLKKATSRLISIAESFSDDSRRLVQGIVGRVKEDYDIPDDESGQPAEKIESLITTPGDIQQR